MNEANNSIEQVACHFCGSCNAVQVRSSADIVECTNCQSTYLRTRLKPNEMYALYQAYADGDSHMKLPSSIGMVKKSGMRREGFVLEAIDFTKGYGTWLDIGCGWGALLDCARDKGFTPMGIELTRKCLDYASLQLRIPCSNTDIVEAQIPSNSLTVVSMAHVLEHLPDPKRALEKIYSILEPGGLFCGIVPNFASFCSIARGEKWFWLDPYYHYVHYTMETLGARLKEIGFSVVKMYTVTGDYNYENVAECLQKVAPEITSFEDARKVIEVIEKDGRGEELRFFARKD